jgi:RNA polymerase sigma-32 factor
MEWVTDEMSIAQLRASASKEPMLSPEREAGLVARIQANERDSAALHELLAAHRRLVVSVVARYTRAGLSTADLVSEGNLGLLEAARRFDPAHGVRFSVYAVWWIRARIGRFVAANRRIVPAPSTRNARKLFAKLRSCERALEQAHGQAPTRDDIASATGTTADEVAMVQAALSHDVHFDPIDAESTGVACSECSPEEIMAKVEAERLRANGLHRALSLLDPREREVLDRRFLESNGDDDGETLADIGRRLGISRERVRQIELAAKRKLAVALRTIAAA